MENGRSAADAEAVESADGGAGGAAGALRIEIAFVAESDDQDAWGGDFVATVKQQGLAGAAVEVAELKRAQQPTGGCRALTDWWLLSAEKKRAPPKATLFETALEYQISATRLLATAY